MELPFHAADHSISMFIFLPVKQTPNAVDEFVNKFSVDTIRKVLTEGESNVVELELPKMHLEGNYMMKDVCYAQFFILLY